MSRQKGPPHEERQEPRQVTSCGSLRGRQGRSPEEPVGWQDAESHRDKMLLDLENAVGRPKLEIFESRSNVDSIRRIKQRSTKSGDGEQQHDGCGVRRGVDVAKSAEERAPV